MSSATVATHAATPTILHADLDAFYASVEQRDDPALRDRPMMVGGGVVLSASYEARRVGVRTAMPTGQARRLCPQIIEVPPRMEAYSAASKAVFEIFDDTTPLVEGLSIDEAFLDVTGLRRLIGPGRVVADRLRQRVGDEVGLAISVGCATTKFLAKVASAVSKPDGLLVVEPGGERAFLRPLPIERLWGVGPATAQRLRAVGMTSVADVADCDPDHLIAILGGATGRHLHAIANNRDERRIVTGRRRRSIGSQRSFRRDSVDRAGADALLLDVADRICGRLRSAERVGRTVTLRLRFGDFSTATRSTTLYEPTSTTDAVVAAGRELLDTAWPLCDEHGLTRVGLSVSNLCDVDAVQLALPFGQVVGETSAVASGVDRAIDDIRDRFGDAAIERATLLGRRGITMPMLPD